MVEPPTICFASLSKLAQPEHLMPIGVRDAGQLSMRALIGMSAFLEERLCSSRDELVGRHPGATRSRAQMDDRLEHLRAPDRSPFPLDRPLP